MQIKDVVCCVPKSLFVFITQQNGWFVPLKAETKSQSSVPTFWPKKTWQLASIVILVQERTLKTRSYLPQYPKHLAE